MRDAQIESIKLYLFFKIYCKNQPLSKLFNEGYFIKNIDLDSMSVNELVRFIQGNPSILKRPILLDERRLLVGYDDEEMEAFVPAQLRSIADSCCNQCPEYDSCGKMREA